MRFKRGAKDSLKSHTNNAVFGRLPAQTDVRALVDRMGKRAVVEMMAGTTDRKSRDYRNARDNLGRYLRGARNPNRSPATRQKLQQVAKTNQIDQMRQRGSMRVGYTADVRKSKRTWKNGHIAAVLDGAALQDYLDALEAGDEAGALAVVMDEYGLPADEVASIENVHDVDLRYE